MNPRRRATLVLSMVLAAVTVTASVPAGAAATGRLAPAGAPAPADAAAAVPSVSIPALGPGTHELTLVTGDRVLLTHSGAGHYHVTVDETALRPAGELDPTFETVVDPGDGVYVYPSDARPAIDAGLLDRQLFNISYLAEHGLLDAASEQLPVIVEYPDNQGVASAQTRAEGLPASHPTATLPSVHAAALAVSKTGAAEFWSAVRGTGTGTANRTERLAPTRLGSGVERIWLDGVAQVTLDESVPLIGAPEAWQAGYDGTGVTVAVLDTGIDADHPDLAGKVVASESFVGDTTVDGHGHGTHVASTIVGDGAASGGQYTGVAPGADLMVGKVCTDDGSCPFSAIVAGMEWAANNGADIVSLSLGGGPTDGTDPQAQAVNNLTASTGALFVIAAGNDGPTPETVATPGTAEAALTVAATTKADAMAGFSSRGPRIDGALKPDIAAPGVSIVAARAAGTSMGTPVNDRYTAANGTSMATPHVSGAAAILAQQHPDWQAGQLKAALMSSSHDAGHTVYEQGAGRVDVARATSQQVYATTASVDFGAIDPGQTPEPVSREVTYRNLTDAEVTLTLTPTLGATDGTPAPGGALTSDPTVTVPAAGTATATVTLDVAALELGTYTGGLAAVDEVAGVRLRTPVGVVRQPPKTTLTVRTIGLDGKPLAGEGVAWLELTAVDVPGVDSVPSREVSDGVFQAVVQQGTYSADVNAVWTDPVTGRNYYGRLIDPQIEVTGATEIVLDARNAEEVTIDTPRPARPYALSTTYQRSRWDGRLVESYTVGSHAFSQGRVLVTPTERVSTGTFRFATRWVMANPQTTMTVVAPERFDLQVLSRAYRDRGALYDDARVGWLPFADDQTLDLVDAGFGDPEDLAGKDLTGKLALLQWGDDRYGPDGTPDGFPESVIYTDRVNNLKQAGAVGYLAVSNPPAGWERNGAFASPTVFMFPPITGGGPEEIVLPEAQLPRDQGLHLLDLLSDGPVAVEVHSDPNIRYSYRLHPFEEQQVSSSLAYSLTDRDLAQVSTSYHAVETLDDGWSVFSPWTPGQTFSASGTFQFVMPQTRIEYIGPVHPDVVVSGLVYRRGDTTDGMHRFDRPLRTSEHWGDVPAAPGVPNLDPIHAAHPPEQTSNFYPCSMCREGDVLWPIYFNTLGDGHTFNNGGSLGLDTRLLRSNGEEVPLAGVPAARGFPGYTLPPEDDTYRLEQDDGKVRTRWTFHSAAPDANTVTPGSACLGHVFGGWTEPCAPEPLVFVGYELGDTLALDNTVAAPGGHAFDVHVYHSRSTGPMPEIAGLRLWASTDGGEQWRPVPVRATGDGVYRATTSYPTLDQTDGSVALRAEAWDAGGNRIEQVIERAFELRDALPAAAPAPPGSGGESSLR